MYERYCKLRDLKGFSDAQVAEYCDFPKSTFSDWKKGKSTPKTDKLVKIAECLECSLDYLVTGKETAPQPESAIEHLQLISLYEKLTEEQKQAILTIMSGMVK